MMSPLIPLEGEQAKQSTFPPTSQVYISANTSPTCILAPGVVVGVSLKMGKPGQLDLLYSVKMTGLSEGETRTELFNETRLRFRNGSLVTVCMECENEEHRIDGIVLGYCDIPPHDDRRAYCSEEFWYSVQLLDSKDENNIRIMHEVSNSQLTHRPNPSSNVCKSAKKMVKSHVKVEVDAEEEPTRASSTTEKSHGADFFSPGGGHGSIATTSLSEIQSSDAKVKFEFDLDSDGRPKPKSVESAHDSVEDVTSQQARDIDNDSNKRKSSVESGQILDDFLGKGSESPMKRMKQNPKNTPKSHTDQGVGEPVVKSKKKQTSRKTAKQASRYCQDAGKLETDSSVAGSQQSHRSGARMEPRKEQVVTKEVNMEPPPVAVRTVHAGYGEASHMTDAQTESRKKEVVTKEANVEQAPVVARTVDPVVDTPLELGDIAQDRNVLAESEMKPPTTQMVARTDTSESKAKKSNGLPSLKIKIPRKRKEWTTTPPSANESHTKTHNGGIYYWCSKCKGGSGLWTGHETMDHIEEGSLVHKTSFEASAGHVPKDLARTDVLKTPARRVSAGTCGGSPGNWSQTGSDKSCAARKPPKDFPFYAIMFLPIHGDFTAGAIIGKGGCFHKQYMRYTNCWYSVSSSDDGTTSRVQICGEVPEVVEKGVYFIRNQIYNFLDGKLHNLPWIEDQTTIEFFGDIEAYQNVHGIGNPCSPAKNEINTRSYYGPVDNLSPNNDAYRRGPPHQSELRILLPKINRQYLVNLLIGPGGRENKRLKAETNAKKILLESDQEFPYITIGANNQVIAEHAAHHVIDCIQKNLHEPLEGVRLEYPAPCP